MKAIIYLSRSVSEAAEIEVKDLDELKALAKDPELLHEEIHRQEKEFEETVGEVLSVSYELDGKTYNVDDENNLIDEKDNDAL